MTPTQRQFVSLLRAGVTAQAADPEPFRSGTDWSALYQLAHEQTLAPVLAEGIEYLDHAFHPADEVALDPFVSDMVATEQRNLRLNAFLPKLTERLQNLALHPLVVKGQVLSKEYRHPTHRQCGDIDLLVLPEEYAAARQFLLSKASRVEEEMPEILHQALYFGSIEVELHGLISTLMSPALDRKLFRIQQEAFARPSQSIPVGNGMIPAPPIDFHALYIFVHMLQHFWSSGVALRQLLDWALFVTHHYDEMDIAYIDAEVQHLGIKNMWQVFAGFCSELFDLPQDRFPLYKRNWPRKNRRIFAYVMYCGNFGKNIHRSRSEENYLLRKLHSFSRLVVRDRLRHFTLFPLESLRFFFGACRYGLERLARGN